MMRIAAAFIITGLGFAAAYYDDPENYDHDVMVPNHYNSGNINDRRLSVVGTSNGVAGSPHHFHHRHRARTAFHDGAGHQRRRPFRRKVSGVVGVRRQMV